MYWLGIDIGTGGSRALLVDENGHVKASFTALHEDMRMDRPLWAEQRPGELVGRRSGRDSRRAAESRRMSSDVRGIGLSGQMHGLTLLDENDKVIRPALIWCDQRSQAQVDYINDKVGRETVLEYTANPVVTGFTLPKLLWVRDNEPRQFDARSQGSCCRKTTSASDSQVNMRQRFPTHPAPHCSMWSKRNWSYEMADALGLDRGILPAVLRVGRNQRQTAAAESPKRSAFNRARPWWAAAEIRRRARSAMELSNPASFPAPSEPPALYSRTWISRTMIRKGRVHTFCHAVPGKWHVMGVTQGAGLSLQWMRNQLMPGENTALDERSGHSRGLDRRACSGCPI